MGFDTSIFISPVHKELICSICFGVFEKPIVLPLCRHVFCQECICNWLSQNNLGAKLCPIDKTTINTPKEELKKKKISYALSNIISDSIVTCRYKSNGCKQSMSLTAYGDHCKTCPFKIDNTNDQSIPTTSNRTSTIVNKQINICKLSHPNRNNAKTYSHPNWTFDKNLVKLTFTSLPRSFIPYNIAGYMKNLIDVNVYCIHTKIEFQDTKDLDVYIQERDLDKVMKPELWPTKTIIDVILDHKKITVHGKMKTTRKENFYGFNERTPQRKERKKLKKKLREENAKKEIKKNKRSKNDSNDAPDQISNYNQIDETNEIEIDKAS